MEWEYLQRVVAGLDEEFQLLLRVIRETFIPTLLAEKLWIGSKSCSLYQRRKVVWQFVDPVQKAATCHRVSREVTGVLQQAILTGQPVDLSSHSQQCASTLINLQGKKTPVNLKYRRVLPTRIVQ